MFSVDAYTSCKIIENKVLLINNKVIFKIKNIERSSQYEQILDNIHFIC